MAQKILRLRPEDHSNYELQHRKPQLRNHLKDPTPKNRDTAYSDYSGYSGKRLRNQDGPHSSAEPQEHNQSHQIDYVYWRKKASFRGRHPPISKSCRIWIENFTTSSLKNPDHTYPCSFKVLESMLRQIGELHTERYGEYMQRETALRETLKGLLRKDALMAFENKVYNLEKLVSYISSNSE